MHSYENARKQRASSKCHGWRAGGDRAALLGLAAAFANWGSMQRTELLGWSEDAPMCGGWAGVTCDPSGSVIGLDLSVPAPSAVAGLLSYDEMMRSSNPFPPLAISLPGPGSAGQPGVGSGSDNASYGTDGTLLPGSNVTVRGSSPLQLRGVHALPDLLSRY